MKKLLFTIVVLGLAIGVYIGYPYYKAYTIGKSETFTTEKNSVTIKIPKGSKFSDLSGIFKEKGIIDNSEDFTFLADFKGYADEEIPFKKLKISNNWNSYNSLVNNLHYAVNNYKGTVDVVISNVRSVEDIAGKVASFIDADSIELSELFNNDSVIAHYGFTKETFPTFFLPNTYECYIDITPEEFLQKMADEYKNFWNAERKQKARDLELSQSEVTILASIVYEEQKVKFDEQDMIAGLYLNRLRKGWLLQADPTVKYAWGDPSIKRLLFKHLEIESPYNTYKYPGLPPGPISIPEPRTIDAVLNYKHHDYYYMCAKPEYSGYHNFSKTLKQHNIYAKEYQKWLNKEGIK